MFFWDNSNAIWGLFGRSCSLKILSKEAQSMASWDFHEVGPESTTLRSFYIGFPTLTWHDMKMIYLNFYSVSPKYIYHCC